MISQLLVAIVTVMVVVALVRLPMVAAAAVAFAPVTRASTVAAVAPAPRTNTQFLFMYLTAAEVHPVAAEVSKMLTLLGRYHAWFSRCPGSVNTSQSADC